MHAATSSTDAIKSVGTHGSSGLPPSGGKSITLKPGVEMNIPTADPKVTIKSVTYEPSNIVNPKETVTIYLAAGGQGFGHIVPMNGVLAELRAMPDTRIIFDKDPPVHKFDRGTVDHLRYKLSNWGPMGRFANRYREHYSATPQFNIFRTRLEDVQKGKVDYAFFNHRFGVHVASEAWRGPKTAFVPDWGKNHRGWFSPSLLKKTDAHSTDLDRLFVTNDTAANHARKYGVPRDSIQTLGYPMRPAYSEWANKSKEEARAHLGIPEGKRVVIMSAGNARNPGPFLDQVKALLADPDSGNLHLVALCNDNESLMKQLNDLGEPGRIFPRGPQDDTDMAPLLRAAHMNAIQPGGGSFSDCYAMQVVGVAFAEKSGIEHANLDHGLKHGTVIAAFERPSLGRTALNFLKKPQNLFSPGQLVTSEANKAKDGQMFCDAIFRTSQEKMDDIIAKQAPFRELAINGSQRYAKTLWALARTSAGFSVEDPSALTDGRPVGPTPTTATPGTGMATPFSPFEVDVNPNSPQHRDVSGSEVKRF